MTETSFAYFHGFEFSDQIGEIIAISPDQVVPALKSLERQLASGLHAAGFVSYEAAPAINSDLTTCTRGKLPLLHFRLYRTRSRKLQPPCYDLFHTCDWQSSQEEESFAGAVDTIRELIAAGDCYQVNFTMRQGFSFSGSPRAFFHQLCRRQPTPYSSYFESGQHRILSASPELFFSVKDGVLTTRPMKGTASRGKSAEKDETQKRRLKESPKELAENLMIVDLLRNDMGIVSQTGTVRVASLFDVETHPTVHQMTSTIESRLNGDVGPLELMQALFPCGSVTGAPKRRSMEIIAQREGEPRGVYTGCLGYFSPGGEALFSVAIRTVVIDLDSGRGEVGVGSGITYDSVGAEEYAESLSKSLFASQCEAEFHLIESLLHDENGYFLLDRHLGRLARSAAYFSFPFEVQRARHALEAAAPTDAGKYKVRLLLFRDGTLSCEAAGIEDSPADAVAGFAEATVDSADPFLYHKTSRRSLFASELGRRPDLAEVIFLNERGEVTEGANSNVVARVSGVLVTPPVASGLLPGTFREELVANGTVIERVLTRRELEEAEEVFLINSVRKWRRARLEILLKINR
ncbi:aminodeoxychorismate synthase component I [Geomonas sp.]|uniref:aminodeoxychorismate synthase component I n=1 Tax=Geomonas sp. TaxID=2651584 RepID=UPI002B4A2E57|nr:aminodeoxychorismate synthase component I [Geomonas sp.]HJV35524.1 aminodeoxychorismate synthase component I [Geomonas sp.]